MTRMIPDGERPRPVAHLADGELLFLVGERQDARHGAPLRSEDASARDWERHLEGCADCGRRLVLLERRMRRVSALVGEIDLPAEFRPPVLRKRPTWQEGAGLRAAAIVLVVLASLLLIPPMRAWAFGWVSAGWTRLTADGPVDRVRAQEPETLASGASTRLGFAPMGDELVILVVAEQARGALILTTTSAPEVILEVIGGTGGETPLVHAGGLRILNVPTSRASYRVALPPSVQRIRIDVGSRTRVPVERARIGREFRVDLR